MFADMAKQQQLKQCPKCKFWVEKADGCDAMHCRCNLVFCYKCGGCLRAKEGVKKCECSSQDQANLRAHEGAHNHNNPGARAAGLMAGLARGFAGGGADDDDDDDDDDGAAGAFAAVQRMAAALGMPAFPQGMGWPFPGAGHVLGGGGAPPRRGGGQGRRRRR